jgi:hypothetical protein
MLNDYIEEMACSLEGLFPNLVGNRILTLALCFDGLKTSVGSKTGNIDPFVFKSAISKYDNLGLNLTNWETTAEKAKYNDKEKSPLGTISPCTNVSVKTLY